MATKTEVTLIDDLDGSLADREGVKFSLDGVDYEIDLSRENDEALAGALAPFISHARRVGGGRGRPPGSRLLGGAGPARAPKGRRLAVVAQDGQEALPEAPEEPEEPTPAEGAKSWPCNVEECTEGPFYSPQKKGAHMRRRHPKGAA